MTPYPSMPLDMANEEEMTVRERRALHAKEQARKSAPSKMLRKAALPAFVILLLAGVAAGFYFTSKSNPDCPGHFHATFAIYIPDEQGAPELVDFASPIAQNGGHYYDLQNRNSGMSLSVHMHQSGAETGSAALAPSQIHFEAPGSCVPLDETLSALDVRASSSKLTLSGGHAQVGQDGTWAESGNQSLRFFVEVRHNETYENVNGARTLKSASFEWKERTWGQIDDYQLRDGEKLLITFGNYSDEQIGQLQAGIPDPISRLGFEVTQ